MANIPIIFSVCNPVECETLTLSPQPTLHNGRNWYCFDQPTCDKVVYWGTSGTTDLWIYSLDGLNGTIISVLDNNYEVPVTSNNLDEEIGFWNNVNETDFVEGSTFAFFVESSTCSNTDTFDDCINELTTFLGTELMTSLMEKGIMETGTISGVSGICKLKEILLDVNPSFTPQEVYEYYVQVLDKGLVVDMASGCDRVISTTVETYLKYAEAVGLTQSAAVP